MESASWLDGEDNWLEAEIVSCPLCGLQLFCALHSPMCDDHRLYCDRCPRAVEISYYDSSYQQLVDGLPADHTWEQLAAVIGPRLKSCVCGSNFCATDLRYCFRCHSLVPQASGKDISPYIGNEDTDRDPTAVEQAEFDRFEGEFIKRDDLWLAPDPIV